MIVADESFFGPTLSDPEGFLAAFTSWYEQHPTVVDVVVDLASVRFVVEFAILFIMLKHTSSRGGRVHLARPQPAVRQLFELTRLAQVFGIEDSLEEAVAAAKRGQPVQLGTPPTAVDASGKPAGAAPAAVEPRPGAAPSPVNTDGPARTPGVLCEFHVRCELTERAGIITVVPGGSTHVRPTTPFVETVTPWLAAHPEVLHLVFDWHAVSAIDDAWSSIPVWLLRQVKPRGGEVTLVGTQPLVAQAMRRCHLDTPFRHAGSVDEALHSPSGS